MFLRVVEFLNFGVKVAENPIRAFLRNASKGGGEIAVELLFLVERPVSWRGVRTNKCERNALAEGEC